MGTNALMYKRVTNVQNKLMVTMGLGGDKLEDWDRHIHTFQIDN